MTARRIILLRHGLTDWNREHRFQGHADIPLNEVGRAQAIDAAEGLVGQGITAILSSDLSRATATATTVGDRLALPVTVDSRLREINVGTWAGLTPDEIAAVDPERWAVVSEGRDGRHSETGETATEAGRRVADSVAEHAASAGEDEILLMVGHGLTIRVASLLLLGLDYSHAGLFHGLSNCHWVVLTPGLSHWRMAAYNRGH